MLIKDVMTKSPACCKPSDRLDTVAKLMVKYDCGEIPVCDGPKLVGVITDRDITTRVVAAGRTPVDVPVREVMTLNVCTVRENQKLDDALEIMEDELVRRLPVVDEDGKVIGILSQADLIARLPTLKIARSMKTVAKRSRIHGYASL